MPPAGSSSSSSSSASGSIHDTHHQQQHSRLQQQLLRLPPFARELIAGGVAGGLAKTCVAPLELVKIVMQTHPTSNATVSGTLRTIWRSEGGYGLFRGNAASVLRIVPYAAIHFGSYEYIRRGIVELAGAEGGHGPDAPAALPLWDLLAGSASGSVAVLCTYPLDLVRTRLAWDTAAAPAQASTQHAGAAAAPHAHHRHPTIMSILRSTTAEEGLAGLYRGCLPTLVGILPYAGLKFYVYTHLKNSYRRWQAVRDSSSSSRDSSSSRARSPQQQEQPQQQTKLPLLATLVFGGAAGLVAQTVTFPLDVVRRQMQVSHLQLAAQAADSPGGSPAGGSSSPSGSVSASTSAGVTASSSSSSSSSTVRRAQPQLPQQARAAPAAIALPRPRVRQAASVTAPGCFSTLHPRHQRQQQVWQRSRGLHLHAPGAPDPTMLQVARQVWRQGRMFRGLSLNYLKVMPSTAIGFTVYDGLKSYLGLST